MGLSWCRKQAGSPPFTSNPPLPPTPVLALLELHIHTWKLSQIGPERERTGEKVGIEGTGADPD